MKIYYIILYLIAHYTHYIISIFAFASVIHLTNEGPSIDSKQPSIKLMSRICLYLHSRLQNNRFVIMLDNRLQTLEQKMYDFILSALEKHFSFSASNLWNSYQLIIKSIADILDSPFFSKTNSRKTRSKTMPSVRNLEADVTSPPVNSLENEDSDYLSDDVDDVDDVVVESLDHGFESDDRNRCVNDLKMYQETIGEMDRIIESLGSKYEGIDSSLKVQD